MILRSLEVRRTRGITVLPTLLVAMLLASCGSVTAPDDHTYRLAPPALAPPPAAPGGGAALPFGVLRVGALELAADLSGDRLLVAEGPVRVSSYHYHHWAGPLDRLVADAVVTGLRRTRRFAHVKAETDRGEEEQVLSGRVLDFHQSWEGDRWCGLVTLDLQLADARGQVLFGEEFRCATPMAGDDPEALVVALSRSVATIVEDFAARCASAARGR